MAADLAETAKADGTTADGEFWYATAAKLLAPLFFAAAHDGRPMADVVRWVDTQEASEVSLILEQVGVPEASGRGARVVVSRRAHAQLGLHHCRDGAGPFRRWRRQPGERVRAGPDLLGGPTRSTSPAPAHDQRRLRGYFSALTQQVLAHAFAQATRAGKPLDPPLLVVLDEAAHIAPLPELDGLAATCASHGIQLVTVWQDLAQVRGPLRLAGSDGAEQPPGQDLPARHR